MSALTDLEALAQSVYLRVKNQQYDDITSTDGQALVANIVDFGNGFIDELENETNPDGSLVYWWFVRDNGHSLGTAVSGDSSITFPTGVKQLIKEENHYVQITVGGVVISSWAVVSPKELTNRSGEILSDRCAHVGSKIVFSRAFTDAENGGAITGDVTTPMTKMVFVSGTPASDNSDILSQIDPRELLVLGIAKNTSLPDIVQGKLSPSFVQKFNDLLSNTIARSNASSQSDEAQRDNLSSIGGVY